MKKLTPEDRERMRQVDERGRAARANMQRVIDEIDARQREREERAQRRVWRRLLPRRHAA
jgi:hypothetical protein